MRTLNEAVPQGVYSANEYSPLDMMDADTSLGTWEEQQCTGLLSVFRRAQGAPEGTPWFRSNRRNLWNSLPGSVTLLVPRGIVVFACSSDCVVLPPSIIQALMEPSRRFQHSGVNQHTYQVFVQACAPAFEAQRGWQKDWQQIREEVVDRNALRALRDALNTLQVSALVYFDWKAAEQKTHAFEELLTRAHSCVVKKCAALAELERLRKQIATSHDAHVVQALREGLHRAQALHEDPEERPALSCLMATRRASDRESLGRLLKSSAVRLPESEPAFASVRDQAKIWLDGCVLADLRHELICLYREAKDVNLVSLGLRALELQRLTLGTAVRHASSLPELKRCVKNVKDLVDSLNDRCVALHARSLTHTVADFLCEHPERGNRYHQLPSQFRGQPASVQMGQTNEDIGSVRQFDVHIADGLHVRMTVILTHITNGTTCHYAYACSKV